MYKIYADNTLIYDSTLEDYKIGKGSITSESNKSGSFTFSIYPDHFHYDKFIRLKTVITVYKSNKINFRGRILTDTSNYYNLKTLTCEGEMGFLRDSIIRPFTFTGTPEELFKKFITEHNSQVDEFKRFKIGKITVTDPNNYIIRANSEYESTSDNITSRLLETLGGYIYITHENDIDQIPTINYLADYETTATQSIEFGENLKDYTKKVDAQNIATAIIPLGAVIDDNNSETEDPKLTIESVNNNLDYVYNSDAVALYGWIFKVVEWDDVTIASNLKNKALEYLQESIKQNISIELNAIDLHLLNHSIESFKMGDYIRVTSIPHNFDSTMLCTKQTIDLLKPSNDSVTLGYTFATFTDTSSKINNKIKIVSNIQETINKVNSSIAVIKSTANSAESTANDALTNYKEVNELLEQSTKDIEAIASIVVENSRNISSNANNIKANADTLVLHSNELTTLKETLTLIDNDITSQDEKITTLVENTTSNSDKIALQDQAINENKEKLNAHSLKIEDILKRLTLLENTETTEPEEEETTT